MKGNTKSATTQGFMRSVSEHLLLERIGTLETRLSQLEKLIMAIQKTAAYEMEPTIKKSPNQWKIRMPGLSVHPVGNRAPRPGSNDVNSLPRISNLASESFLNKSFFDVR